MNPHNLSASELQLFDTLVEGSNITFLSSIEKNAKYDFLRAFLLEQLQCGKSFVFRVKDKNQFHSILRDLQLQHLSIDLKKDTQIQREQLQSQGSTDRCFQVEAIKSSISYRKTLERLIKLKEEYNQEVFGEYPRLKLAELYYLSHKRKRHFSLDLDLISKQYAFTQKEFWQIRGKIEKAAKHYKSSFSFLRASDEFYDDVYRDFHLPANQEIVFKYLQKFISDAEQLSIKYRASFQGIRASLVSSYNQHIKSLSKLNNDLELQVEFYKIENELAPARKSFGRNTDTLEQQKIDLRTKYSLLLKELESGQLFKVKAPENSWQPDVEKLASLNIDLTNRIENAHQLIENKVDEQVEILNANNFDAPVLAEMVKEQSDLLYAINGSKLFKNEIHNLSISTWKNYLFLKKLTKKLLKSKIFLECNIDYATYRSYEFTLEPKVSQLISSLENIKNSEWVETFEAWYFKALFTKYSTRDLAEITKKFENLSQLKYVDSTFQLFRINTFFSQQQENNQGFSKKVAKEGVDWKSLMISSKDGFKSHFPIVVCDEDFFTSEITNLEYDFLICIENDEIPQNIFANSHFLSILCLIPSVLTPQLKQSAFSSKNYQSKKLVNLKSKTIPYGLKISQNLSEKISLSKGLTYVLGQSSYEKQFYSARNFSIITCLSPFCTKLIELELLDIRIKSLKYTHIETGIVDDVILKEDDSKYLIIQDGFLDPMLDIEWQVNALRRIQESGINLLIIHTDELAINNEKRIIELLTIPELKTKIEELA